MNCPICKTPMLVVEYEGIELDHCSDCLGTWFDREELELLLGQVLPGVTEAFPSDIQSLPDAETGEKARRCPLCRRKMRKVYLGHKDIILIDNAAFFGRRNWPSLKELEDLIPKERMFLVSDDIIRIWQ